MFAIRCLLIAVVVCSSAVAGNAQQDDMTVDTKATPKDIQKWLNSNDPRLIAWGAYFARENADTESVISMLRFVENWTPPDAAKIAFGHSQIDAMREVLDALIQRNEPISPAGLSAIASTFPNQSLILASRLPLTDATPLLLAWYKKRDSSDYSAIPRIAAMMLAKNPPPGFAASVLIESEVNLEVTVEYLSGTGFGHGYGSSIDCGDSMGIGLARGWPPLFNYDIEESSRSNNDPAIVEAGSDRITFHRIPLSGSGSCAYPRPLNAATRHRLLAEMLGVTEKKIAWQVQESSTIFWKSQKQYKSELESLIASEEAKLHGTAKALYARGVLTKEETDSVRPKLSITIFDYRKPAGKPLPHLERSDSRTTITYKQP